ncbi:MAG TPA: hypothetical protein VN176_04365 [Verrucomicrobiae bacterium]|nr:hypothetical protein [Verrucomicrobiae bacterium]
MKQLSALALAFACSLAAAGQVLTGVVVNGTTNKPAAGDTVILLKLSQGMQEEAKTKTNARGEFRFKLENTGGMRLVRVRHADVNYHEPVLPDSTSVRVTVFDSKSKVPEIKLLDQSEVYQASNDTVQVVELFRLNNTSSPPMTQPDFEFYLPEGATVRSGNAVASSSMPIKTPPIAMAEKNRYQVLYPIRPGETQFEIVYTLPYTGSLKVSPKLNMTPDKFYVVTPRKLQFSAAGGSALQPAAAWPVDGTIKGVETHAADTSKPGTDLAFEISGTGMLQDDSAARPSGGNQDPTADNRPGGGLGVPNEQPGPLHSAQWLLLGILVLCLGAGAVFVYFNNQPAPAVVAAAAKPTDRSAALLEAMKEEIFQLETDRLQGKISPEEYDAAKSAMDKTLQRAMRRQQK